MRKLATIRRIDKIDPIDGADLIAAAQVDGWQCVIKKSEFQPGDLAVYFEIDSFLNGDDPRYSSFEDKFINWSGKRGLRIRTMRLRKTLSQGLLMPLSTYPELSNVAEGDDVTELLKVEKWEPADEAANNNGGTKNGGSTRPFPSFIPKTDQERAQNLKRKLEQSAADEDMYEVTVKLDGSSLTVWSIPRGSLYFNESERITTPKQRKKSWHEALVDKVIVWFKHITGRDERPQFSYGVASRNVTLKRHDGSAFWNIVQTNHIIEKLQTLGYAVALQGELIAPNIQSNWEKVSGPMFFVYDVWLIDEQRYLLPDERLELLTTLDIPNVPVIDVRVSINTIKERTGQTDVIAALLQYADGPSLMPNAKREGTVYKAVNSDFSFKVISNTYLLAKK